jgi:hypothetical protein
VKTWEEAELQSQWARISDQAERIRERLDAARRQIAQGDEPRRADARSEAQQLTGRLAAYEAEEQAIGGRLDVVREDRQLREAEARPRLAAARSAYDDAIARLEARAEELAELRAAADEAARLLSAVQVEAGEKGGAALLPTRITIWKNADPSRARDWLVDWRR